MKDIEKLVGINTEKEPIIVKHSELERANDGPFKSKCPKCVNGFLMIYRNPNNLLEFLKDDHCILCGQHFIYSDIDELNNRYNTLKEKK